MGSNTNRPSAFFHRLPPCSNGNFYLFPASKLDCDTTISLVRAKCTTLTGQIELSHNLDVIPRVDLTRVSRAAFNRRVRDNPAAFGDLPNTNAIVSTRRTKPCPQNSHPITLNKTDSHQSIRRFPPSSNHLRGLFRYQNRHATHCSVHLSEAPNLCGSIMSLNDGDLDPDHPCVHGNRVLPQNV